MANRTALICGIAILLCAGAACWSLLALAPLPVIVAAWWWLAYRADTIASVRASAGRGPPPSHPTTDVQTLKRQLSQTEKLALANERKAREAIEQISDNLRHILDTLPLILIAMDHHGVVTRWNRTAEATFGLTASQVMGLPLRSCGLVWDWEAVSRAIEQMNGRQSSLRLDDIAFQGPDKQRGFVGITLLWVSSGPHTPPHLLISASDVTHRRQQEVHAVHTTKLEAIGQLAAGIAHEINTPIQYIGDNVAFVTQWTRNLFVPDAAGIPLCTRLTTHAPLASAAEIAALDVDYHAAEIPTALRQTLEGLRRVTDIIHALNDFSCADAMIPTQVDLNRCVQNAATISRHEYRQIAEVVFELESGLTVLGFSTDLHQVFTNLIVNAAHAIGEVVAKNGGRGTITLATRRDGDSAVVTVSDTGAGIPIAIRDRICEPFFTTKAVGKGTGQGLYLSRQIIAKRHGGTLSFTPLAVGTMFTIRMPLVGQTPTAVSGA